MRQKLIPWLLPCAFATALPAATATTPPLLLVSGEWAPYLSARLPQRGFAAAVVSEAAQLGGLTVSYRDYPWQRAESLVRYGVVDGSLLWTASAARRQFAWFSAPVLHDREVVIYRRDQALPDWPQRARWRGLHVVRPLGSRPLAGLLRLARSGQIRYSQVESANSGLRMILAGRVQAMTMAEASYRALAEQMLRAAEREQLAILPTAVETLEFSVMLSKADPRNRIRLQALNRGLQRLRISGRYAELQRQLLPAIDYSHNTTRP